MKPKQLIVLTIILVLIIAGLVLKNVLQTMQPAQKSLVFFPSLYDHPCASLLIVDKADSVRLVKKGDAWFVAGATSTAAQGVLPLDSAAAAPAPASDYPADSASIQAALEKLKTMKKSKDDIISGKPEKFATFEVDSAHATLVQAWDDQGKSVGSFYIGKNGADWTSNFVRLTTDSDVYQVGGSIKSAFFADRKRWRDKTIIKFDRSAAQRITLVKQASTIRLEKTADSAGASSWNITAPEKLKARQTGIDELLTPLSNFTGGDWEEDQAEIGRDTMGFNKPELVATVALAGGSEKQITVGRKKGATSRFWVKNASMPGVIFLVDEWNVGQIDKNMETLKDTAVAAPLPAAAEKPKQ